MLTPEDLEKIEGLAAPFYKTWDFWIFIVLTLIGIGISVGAWVAADNAKKAATKAAKVVKLQTTIIELAEIVQDIERLNPDITFQDARAKLNFLNRKLRRLMGAIQNLPEFEKIRRGLNDSLNMADVALNQLQPNSDASGNAPNMIYYGLQGRLSDIGSIVADWMGLLESKQLE